MNLIAGDCLEALRGMESNSVDAVVTDPPYGLSFMGKRWDYDVPSVEVWAECLRVLKPGGHLLAFAGTRTQHRMAVRIEDAGFEIRDMIAWVYGSGFPKSLDVSKAMDKAAGALQHEGRGMLDKRNGTMTLRPHVKPSEYTPPPPATAAAKKWHGWGTALKPAMEPITVARKPIIGTVAENMLTHGTGAINVDGCRVGCSGESLRGGGVGTRSDGWDRPWKADADAVAAHKAKCDANADRASTLGRWPANLIHDGSEEVLAGFPETKARGNKHPTISGGGNGAVRFVPATISDYGPSDSGSAARFFYCAKASKRDRDEGLDSVASMRGDAWGKGIGHASGSDVARKNIHPTVKPTDLMRYLCRLVTPPGGVVLDPFMGSGSTGKAAVLEGFRFIGIEREAEYVRIASARIEHAHNQQNHPLHPD